MEKCIVKLTTKEQSVLLDLIRVSKQSANKLMHARALIDPDDTRPQTREIRRLNAHIHADTRVDVSLLPLADGLFLVRPH